MHRPVQWAGGNFHLPMSRPHNQGIAHLATILTLPVVFAIALLGESWWGALVALLLGGAAVLLYQRRA